MLISAMLGLLVLAAFASLGLLVIRLILGTPDRLVLFGLSVPIGGGLTSWALFVASWIGIPLTWITCFGVWLMLMGLTVVLGRSGWPRLEIRQPLRRPVGSTDRRWVAWTTWICLGALIGVATFISLADAYGSWDAVAIWASKGLGIAKDQTILAGETWGAWGLAYPLNIPLQIAVFQIFGHDLVPLSKAIFPIYLASLALGGYAFWRHQGASQVLTGLGSLFLASVPLIFLHGTEGYANLPLTAYLVQGVLWAIVGLSVGDRRSLLMSGLLLGLASWTRAEAIGYCLAAVIALIASFWLASRREFHFRWWLTPLALMSGVWFLFGWGRVGSSTLGGAMRAFKSGIMGGDLHLRQLYLIPRLLFDRAQVLTRWGTLFEVAAVLVLARIFFVRPRKHPEVFAAFVTTAMLSLAVVGIWYVRSYSLSSTYITVLNRSFDRAFFPAAAMMIITAVRMYANDPPSSGKGRDPVRTGQVGTTDPSLSL